MTSTPLSSALAWLIAKYFSRAEQCLPLALGEMLMHQDHFNDRLYLVRQGTLVGHLQNPDGSTFELFRATRHMFVGVYSFFSRTYRSSATVVAECASEVAFIDQHQTALSSASGASLFEQFMPVVVADLMHRQQRTQEIAMEKEHTLRQLIRSEKLASLGQMAAGLAHELNNAIAVLERSSAWLSERMAVALRLATPEEYVFYDLGLVNGRVLSSSEVRARSRELRQRFRLSEESAHLLAQTGAQEAALRQLGPDLEKKAAQVHTSWELGATLRDMLIAAQHATHVVKSVRDLGATQSTRQPGRDVNESLREALALLASPLRRVSVKLALAELPAIVANKGELVQVWVNLIRNACESMIQGQTPDPELRVSSAVEQQDIVVRVQDNGPGIAPELLPRIFQPNVTTKAEGLAFGLGLGLTIVERILHSYGGSVTAASAPGATIFTVRIPLGDSDGEA